MNDPVLVIGAGPVGLTLALGLKRLGVELRLVDKSPAPTDKSKALVLWPRTLELLDILGCVRPFLDAGNMTKLAILRNPILQEIRSFALGALGHIAALRQLLVHQLTEVDLHYRDSRLTSNPHGAARHPAGGERTPDMALVTASGASRLHEILSAGRFAVVSVGAEAAQLPPSLHNIAVAAAAESAAGYDAGHVYLIRPDAYPMSTRPDDIAAITVALERIRTG